MSTPVVPEPQPHPDPPAAANPTTVGGGLRVSDADREQVATVLSTAYAEGRLTREEHDERLDQVWQAKTFDDLIPVTHDLVVVPPTMPSSDALPPVQSNTGTDEPDRLVAIFGGCVRKNRWNVRRNIQSVALFGGVELDMTEATFEGPVIEINGFWCFGGLDITVPDGVDVRDQTMGVFGGTDISKVSPPVAGAPVLVVKGLCLFGGVSVHGPKKGKSR